MPDLTVEYYWVCQKHADWWKINQAADALGYPTDPEPDCTWNQFLDGGEPLEIDGERKCPVCGGSVTSYGMGV